MPSDQVIHLVTTASESTGAVDCCGKMLSALGASDLVTSDRDQVTCTRPAPSTLMPWPLVPQPAGRVPRAPVRGEVVKRDPQDPVQMLYAAAHGGTVSLDAALRAVEAAMAMPAPLEQVREADSPEWLITGLRRHSGGVTVIAGAPLTGAQLARRRTYIHGWRGARIPSDAYLLAATITGITSVSAETYESGVRSLGELWKPPE